MKHNMTSVEKDITEMAKSYTMYQIGKVLKNKLTDDSDIVYICM